MSQKENKENACSQPKKILVHYIRCPFDNSHFVHSKHYKEHTEKCRRDHPEVQLLFCPFNTCHRFWSLDLLVNKKNKFLF